MHAWCNLQPSGVQETCSVKTAGNPCRLQGCWDEYVYVADLHIGETHVRVSMMMLPALRGSDGKSHVSCHMHESVCFSRFRLRPSDAQSQDGLPHMSGQMELCWELRPADFGTSNRGACSEGVVARGSRGQAFQVVEDNLGAQRYQAFFRMGAAMCFRSCAPKMWSLQVWKTRPRL